MLNPLVKLYKLFKTLPEDNKQRFLKVTADGNDFEAIDLDALLLAIKNDPALYANLSAKKINGKTIDRYIEEDIKPHINHHEHTNLDTLNLITDEKVQEWDAKMDPIGYTPEDSSKRGQADGYASLDDQGKIPLAQMPDIKRENAVVNTLAERDQLTGVYPGLQCVVVDEDQVAAGEQCAVYLCTELQGGTTPVWKLVCKVDPNVISGITWANIQNKPNSTPQEIDTAVGKAHEHANLVVLNKFTFDTGEDKLKFDNKDVCFGNNVNISIIDSIKVVSDEDTKTHFVINDPKFVANKDKLLNIYYAGIRITPDFYTFVPDTSTLQFKNGLSINNNESFFIEFDRQH